MNKSIVRRFIWIYIFLLGVTLFGIGMVYYQVYQVQNITQKKVEQFRRVQSLTQSLEAEINYLSYLAYNYLLMDSELIKSRSEGVWEERLETNIDSLSKLVNSLNEKELTQSFKEVRFDLSQLEDIWLKIFNNRFSSTNDPIFEDLNKSFDLRLAKIRREFIRIAGSQETRLKLALLQVERNAKNARTYSMLTLLVVIAIGVFLTFILVRRVFRINRRMSEYLNSLLEGNLPPEPLPSTYVEFMPLNRSLERLKNTFLRLRNLANEVRNGSFNTKIRVFDDRGVLGQSLAGMRESLQEIAVANQHRNWFNEGTAQFSEILRNSQEADQSFYDQIISYLVNYLEVNQGGIFAIDDTGEEAELVLKSAYAFERNKYIKKSFRYGEGLVGQVWREADSIYINDIPENYTEITSGLGHSKPRYVLITPLISNDEVVGVLELASFKEIEQYKIDFIERVGEGVSSTLARLKVDAETKLLLNESQDMAEKVLAQEEEMRQNMDTLMSTQQKMELKSQEMEAQLKALDESFIMMDLDTEGNFISVNQLLLRISGYLEEELMGQHHSVLFGNRKSPEEEEEEWNQVLGGQNVKGVFARYTKYGKKFWLYEVIYPLFNQDRIVDKVCVIGYEITKQKEQEIKIKEQLNELHMSRRDVVNRIREVEGKARTKVEKLRLEYSSQLQEKERIIQELKS